MTENVPFRSYVGHGLRISSQIPLGAEAPHAAAPDLTIRWDPTPARTPKGGRVLARFDVADATWFIHRETDDEYVLSYTNICDIRLDRARREMTVRPMVDGRPDMIPLMVAGNALAFTLQLGGACVLHAAAVALEQRAIAFLGRSGIGKSTLAAVCCVAGARLVSDDVLHVTTGPGPIHCHSGPPTLRLRTGAAALAPELTGASRTSTVDGRVGVTFPAPPEAPMDLAAIVLPRPTRERTTPLVRRVPPAEALLALMGAPRVSGILAPELVRSLLAGCARVVEAIPVYLAEVPWGPPFAPQVATTLLDLAGLRPSGTTLPA